MYQVDNSRNRLRALILAGVLTLSPTASALSPDGGFSLSDWLQQIISSIFMTSATEDGDGGGMDPDGGSIHTPGG